MMIFFDYCNYNYSYFEMLNLYLVAISLLSECFQEAYWLYGFYKNLHYFMILKYFSNIHPFQYQTFNFMHFYQLNYHIYH